MNEDCIFCKMSANKIPARKIYENDNFFSIPDANPRLGGHSLIISKKHFKTALDLPASLGQELLDCIKNTAIILMKKQNSEGFNLISNNFSAAGQAVYHFHLHIIPRKEGDNFRVV